MQTKGQNSVTVRITPKNCKSAILVTLRQQGIQASQVKSKFLAGPLIWSGSYQKKAPSVDGAIANNTILVKSPQNRTKAGLDRTTSAGVCKRLRAPR